MLGKTTDTQPDHIVREAVNAFLGNKETPAWRVTTVRMIHKSPAETVAGFPTEAAAPAAKEPAERQPQVASA
jgi:hypothetical protein